MESREEAVTAALLRAGVPADRQAEFVRFELEWGGRHDGLDAADSWGLIHAAPRWGNTEPGEVSAEFDAHAGRWFAVCADVHPSDMWTIDDFGNLWDGRAPSTNRGHFAGVLRSWS